MLGAVIGNYQIVQKLGEGGMGVVYLGQHTLLGRRAAIKVLLAKLSARSDIVTRFFNEARTLTKISDPGIVQVFDFGYHTDGSAFIVMEFLEGEPLDQRLARHGKLSVNEALRLCQQIASSLGAAHAQHIIHRDLKPENIFLVHDRTVASGERSKILDFGIAKLVGDHPGMVKTSTGVVMGTPIYMSPEQCRGLAEFDHRSDIYALGCVLFHLITGRPPFDGEGIGDIIAAHIREPAPAPSSRVPGIAPSVDMVVLRCLAKAPADRYQSMGELVAAIGRIAPYQTSPDSLTQYMYANRDGTTLVPPPYPSRSEMPAMSCTKLLTPTTFGASAGQVRPTPLISPMPARSRKLVWWIASVTLLGAASTAIAMVTARNGGTTHTPTATQDVGVAAASVTPDAAIAHTAATAIDAGVPDASPPDASSDVRPDAALDAALIDAPAGTARGKRHHTRNTLVPTEHTGSSTVADPSGCDRSIDTDCDGIPDVR